MQARRQFAPTRLHSSVWHIVPVTYRYNRRFTTHALPGNGRVGPTQGWRWSIGHLDAHASTTLIGTFRLSNMPAGGAVLFVPEATACGLGLLLIGQAGGSSAHASLAVLTASLRPEQQQIAVPAFNIFNAQRKGSYAGNVSWRPFALSTLHCDAMSSLFSRYLCKSPFSGYILPRRLNPASAVPTTGA
jgi:hypothetical protein